MLERKSRVAVIGAGISGLICAYELQKKGYDVTVFEKESFAGGRMASRRKSNFLFDTGANFFVKNYKNIPHYCNELGIGEKWHRMHMGHIYSYWKGALHVSSTGALGTLFHTDILPVKERLKLINMYRDLANKGSTLNFYNLATTLEYDTVNAYDYTKEHVGQLAADYVVDPFARTYQFHSSKEISLAAMVGILGAMINHTREFTFYYTTGGMGELPKALRAKLNVQTNQTIDHIVGSDKKVQVIQGNDVSEFDYCVLATTADRSKYIYKNPSEKQKNIINEVHYAKTIMSAFTVPKDILGQLSLVMVPYVEGGKIAEYTREGYKGPGFITDKLSVMNAGLHEEFAKEIMHKSDSEVFRLIKEALVECCPPLRGHEDLIKPLDLQRWDNAMPKFSTHYLTHVENYMQNGQGENRVFLCGDYLNSPWTEGSCECGKRVSEQLDKVASSDSSKMNSSYSVK